MSKLTSRKFWTLVVGQVVGISTAVLAALNGSQETMYAGFGVMVATALGYLKAESEVDKARADSEADLLWRANHLNKGV